MRLFCTECGKIVSTEVPDGTIIRANLLCPECLELVDEDVAEKFYGQIAERSGKSLLAGLVPSQASEG